MKVDGSDVSKLNELGHCEGKKEGGEWEGRREGNLSKEV